MPLENLYKQHVTITAKELLETLRQELKPEPQKAEQSLFEELFVRGYSLRTKRILGRKYTVIEKNQIK